ncbi:hypothetical protein FQR65_LT05399 [Abscondita terminalis]|nr:hypothetical protein FQR65_LT05399 [Abscondita terminalis]
MKLLDIPLPEDLIIAEIMRQYPPHLQYMWALAPQKDFDYAFAVGEGQSSIATNLVFSTEIATILAYHPPTQSSTKQGNTDYKRISKQHAIKDLPLLLKEETAIWWRGVKDPITMWPPTQSFWVYQDSPPNIQKDLCNRVNEIRALFAKFSDDTKMLLPLQLGTLYGPYTDESAGK